MCVIADPKNVLLLGEKVAERIKRQDDQATNVETQNLKEASENLLFSVSEAIQRAASEAHVSEHVRSLLKAQVLSTALLGQLTPEALDISWCTQKNSRCKQLKYQ